MTSRRGARLGAVAAVVVATLIPALSLGAEAGQTSLTIRTNVASNGTQANRLSGRFSRPAISGNARFTAFDSLATNLVPNDVNLVVDVFAHDAVTGQTEKLSVSTSGQDGNGDSQRPSMDQQGRFVAFDSASSTLGPNDNNSALDVFVRDRVSDRTIRVSVAMDGGAGNAQSFYPSISATGRYVAFISDASNLVPNDTNLNRDIFVRDLVARTTELVSVSSDETLQNSSAATPAISADGSVVTFASFATNLVPGDTNGHFDVFVRDRTAGTTVRASVATNGTEGNQPSTVPGISGDGQFVAFASDSTNLVATDTNDRGDVFVHSLATGQTFRASVASNGAQANGQSNGPGVRGGLTFGPVLSFDGTKVAFDSIATNLVAGDTNSCPPSYQESGRCPDIFVRDWVAGTTVRVSVATDGTQGNDASTDPAISFEGGAVAFFSAASNLVPGDTNVCPQFPTVGHCADVFVHFGP
jgi:Tol biopolymer transport system component